MSASTPPPPDRWPLRPDLPRPSRDWAAEFLELRRTPARGNLTGLSEAIADWLNIDVLLVRSLFILTGLFSGIGVIAYVIGWMLTRASTTGTAPLDQIGGRWRREPPHVVASWALAVGIIATLLVGAIMGIGWLPIGVLALTIWAGYRTRHRGQTGGFARSARSVRYWTPPDPHAAKTTPKTHDRVALMITIITLILAAGVGVVVFLGFPDLVIMPLAAALAVIGLGLLVIANRAHGLGLIIPGAMLAAMLTAATITMPPSISGAMLYHSGPAQPANLSLDGKQEILNITAIEISKDENWQIDLDHSELELIIPADQNIVVEVSYDDSVLFLPKGIFSGAGQTSTEQIVDEDRPTLVIEIFADDSQLWVSAA